MELTFTQKKSIRKNFGKLKESLSIPNLIEVQKNSYKQFIESKSDIVKGSTLDKGLTKVFKSALAASQNEHGFPVYIVTFFIINLYHLSLFFLLIFFSRT